MRRDIIIRSSDRNTCPERRTQGRTEYAERDVGVACLFRNVVSGKTLPLGVAYCRLGHLLPSKR